MTHISPTDDSSSTNHAIDSSTTTTTTTPTDHYSRSTNAVLFGSRWRSGVARSCDAPVGLDDPSAVLFGSSGAFGEIDLGLGGQVGAGPDRAVDAFHRGGPRPDQDRADVAVVKDHVAAVGAAGEPEAAALVAGLVAPAGREHGAGAAGSGVEVGPRRPDRRPTGIPAHPVRDDVAGVVGLVEAAAEASADLGEELLALLVVAVGEAAQRAEASTAARVTASG